MMEHKHVKTGNEIFVYKLFNKRNKFLFFIVRMPHFEKNIRSTIFYGSIFSSYSRIYTETGAFFWRTLFKDAIASSKSTLHK